MQLPNGHQCPAKLPDDTEMPPSRSLAVYMAGKVVSHARNMKNIHEEKMRCKDCKLLPNKPVTGRCGHTRCTMCINRNGACPCGVQQPEILHSNILVRDIVEKIMYSHSLIRSRSMCSGKSSSGRIQKYPRLHRKKAKAAHIQTLHKDVWLRRMAASPQIRYEYARELVSIGRFHDAAAHLAHVAAASDAMAQLARNELAKVITILKPARDPGSLIRTLYQSIRLQSSTAMIDLTSIECPICFNVMAQPVTTTCGHTFCRNCIKRCMESSDMCPLCSSSLRDFYLAQTKDTEFLCALVGSIANRPLTDPDFIPIFECTVAYPNIPCPLMIFNFEYRNVVSGVLDSGSRRFGMLATHSDSSQYAHYGTIVEIRDCVVFEDGRSILTTVGICRFKVLEKVTINGCLYARVQEHTDILPVGEVQIFDLQLLAEQIRLRVEEWLPSLEVALRRDMSTCFGTFPDLNAEGEWWRNPNGPFWLWWLIAVLPLKRDIQILMLSTKHLAKRMAAVLRTLDALDYYEYVYRML